MVKVKFENIQGFRYSITVDKNMGVFNITDNYNGRLSNWYTGSEGMEIYRDLKRARRTSKLRFDGMASRVFIA